VAEAQIEITQVRSLIGRVEGQRRTMRALGLRKIRQTVTQPDRPEIRGMIRKVAHLVEVRYPGEEVVDLQPGQEPKGAGNPAAGPSVADDDAAARAEALEEIREAEPATPLGDLVDNAPTLTSVENPDRPKPAAGTVVDDAADETPVSDRLDPEVDTTDTTDATDAAEDTTEDES
jgi:large subunit ribosomal protein L30